MLKVVQNLVQGLMILLCLIGVKSRANNPQKHLCLIALYLLIWGEAVNFRVLPERLCHIFHHVSCILAPRSYEVFLISSLHGLVRGCFEFMLVVGSYL